MTYVNNSVHWFQPNGLLDNVQLDCKQIFRHEWKMSQEHKHGLDAARLHALRNVDPISQACLNNAGVVVPTCWR